MIVGIGMDIVEVERLRASIEKYGTVFLNHVFTSEEQELAAGKGKGLYTFYAGRWAAKEAVSKALGTGFGEACAWLDICILNNAAGAPVAELTGNAARTAEHIGMEKLHISISHEKNYACAVAVAEGASQENNHV